MLLYHRGEVMNKITPHNLLNIYGFIVYVNPCIIIIIYYYIIVLYIVAKIHINT